ncbi:MAG TPA: hypothetical protein VFZ65_06745 [Planctomycetota bacterium]|nr:hypothetical protein [Planctomycetota bacterium]
MPHISVQELKQGMASVLRRIKSGEWFTLMRHGRPVAQLGPATEPGVHTGRRYEKLDRIPPLGRRATGGAYLDVLLADRSGEDA